MKKNTKTHRLMNQTDRQIRQERLPKCLAVTDATGRDPLKAVVGGWWGRKRIPAVSVAAQWV